MQIKQKLIDFKFRVKETLEKRRENKLAEAKRKTLVNAHLVSFNTTNTFRQGNRTKGRPLYKEKFLRKGIVF